MPGVFVRVVPGVGRAAAETAALIFTSGYVDRMPQSLSDSGRALSVHIYDLAANVLGGYAKALGKALVLRGLLLTLRGRLTQVIVTHNITQAKRVADDVAVFCVRDGVGTLIGHGSADEVFNNPRQPGTWPYVAGTRGGTARQVVLDDRQRHQQLCC